MEGQCKKVMLNPKNLQSSLIRPPEINQNTMCTNKTVMSLHPFRNISGLGDRDSECRVSDMFEGVHPTLRRNCQGRRGCLEIAFPNKPLVSPRFTLIWPTVPPDWHSHCVNIHSLKTNKSQERYSPWCLWFLPECHRQPPLSCKRRWFPASLWFVSKGNAAGSSIIALPLWCCNICRAPCQIS